MISGFPRCVQSIKRQPLLGDMVVPYIHIEEKKCTVLLCDEAQKPYAVVEFQ